MQQSISRNELIEIIKEILREMNEASTTANVPGYQTPYAFSGGLAKNKKKKKDLIKRLHMKLVGKLDEATRYSGPPTVELSKLKDAIKMFQKKVKKQGHITNARDEDHLKNLIKIYKQMGGKGVKEGMFDYRNQGDIYGAGFNDSRGNNTSMFKDKKTGRYYIYVKTKNQKGYFDMPKNIKSRSQADDFHMKVQDMIKAGKKLKLMKEGRYHEYRNDETRTPKQKIWHSVREVRDSLMKLERNLKHAIKLKNEQGMDSRTYYKYAQNSFPKIQEKLIKMAKRIGELSA